MHFRIISIILGLYPTYASSTTTTHQIVTTIKISLEIARCPPGGQNLSPSFLIENHLASEWTGRRIILYEIKTLEKIFIVLSKNTLRLYWLILTSPPISWPEYVWIYKKMSLWLPRLPILSVTILLLNPKACVCIFTQNTKQYVVAFISPGKMCNKSICYNQSKLRYILLSKHLFILPENWVENSCLFWVLNDERFACSFDLVYLSKMYRCVLGYKGERELITAYQ